jgi:cobalt-zinc-cadmium efflux system protein
MSEHHDCGHHHVHSTDNIKLAFFLNLGFALLELVGGMMSNSMAIMSDALHDFGDSLMLGSAWYLENVSERKRDPQFPYGYKRFSLLSALLNSLVLLLGSLFIIAHALPRLWHPEAVNVQGMLALAVFGVAVNLFAMLRLRQGHSHNEQVISLHFLEDVLGWVAVLVVGVVMLFVDVPILDPLLSIGIAAYIASNALKNLWATSRIFLQAIPHSIQPDELVKNLRQQFPECLEIHDVRLWTMDGNEHILSLHLVVADASSTAQISALKQQVREYLQQQQIAHVTMEVEYRSEHCQFVMP